MKNQKESDNQTSHISFGMCIGTSLGVAIGASTDNLGLWLPLGISLGICFGSLLDARNRKRTKDTQQEDTQPEDMENKE